MGMDVKLSVVEVRLALTIAQERYLESRQRRRSNAHGQRADNMLDNEFVGALGEIAVAKFLKRYPQGLVGSFKNPDVGSFQVRATDIPDGRLIIRETDRLQDNYIFAIVDKLDPFNCKVAGWIAGRDLESHPDWKQSPNGRETAWFVPQYALNDLKPKEQQG
jgi:hypothetical protein